jgi:hypothetical protein
MHDEIFISKISINCISADQAALKSLTTMLFKIIQKLDLRIGLCKGQGCAA